MLNNKKQFCVHIHRQQKNNYGPINNLYVYENSKFRQLNKKEIPNFIDLFSEEKKAKIGLKRVSIERLSYKDTCKCITTLETKKGVSKGTVSCNFWGEDQSIIISLFSKAIGKYSPPTISDVNIKKGEYYYVGLEINDHISPNRLAYVIFSRKQKPKFVNKPPNCSNGFGIESYIYQDSLLCSDLHYGWRIVKNQNEREFPSPCSEVYDFVYWDDHIWGGSYDITDNILTICQFSKDLSNSLQIFTFSVDKANILNSY